MTSKFGLHRIKKIEKIGILYYALETRFTFHVLQYLS